MQQYNYFTYLLPRMKITNRPNYTLIHYRKYKPSVEHSISCGDTQ
jgi:hypothetical protein